MKRFIKNKEKFDLNFYQDYLKDLYSEINEVRNFDNLYGYLSRTSGYLGKVISLGTQEIDDFILPFSWLFAICNFLNIRLLDAFLMRYPGICPYCLEQKCVCYKTGKTPLRQTPPYKMKEELYAKYEQIKGIPAPYNLGKAINNVRRIFEVNEIIWYTIKPPWQHIGKIHEEIAEIHEAYGSYHENPELLHSVADEIADVFAWILAAWGIIYPNDSLDDVMINYYYDGCPLCKRDVCRCGLYNSRLESLIDFSQLEIIHGHLNELQDALPNFEYEIVELIESYENAIKTHSGPVAKVTLSNTYNELERIKQELSTKEEQDDTILEKISTCLNIAKKILLNDSPGQQT